MKTTRIAFAALLLAGSSVASLSPVLAEPPHMGGHGGGHGAPHFTFAHRDFGHFSHEEHDAWVGGRWDHGWHNGRFGWWWFAGGFWYFYDAPVYPYPVYVSDVYADDEGGGPSWYYCANPPGYYPYVQRCFVPWQAVPATPPPPPSAGPGYGPPPGANGGPPQDQPPPGAGDQPPPGTGYPPPPPPNGNPPPNGAGHN